MVRYHGSGGNVGWLMCVWILFFFTFFWGMCGTPMVEGWQLGF